MDVQHLPLEHPATYKRVRNFVVNALVPALTIVLEPVWAGLPRENTQRRDRLTVLLMQHRDKLQRSFFEHLPPIKLETEGENAGRTYNTLEFDTRTHTGHRDVADTTWDLVVWSIDVLLQQTFEGRKVCAMESQGTIIRQMDTPEGDRIVPFFLDQLARKLSGLDQLQPSHIARCIQGVFSDVSAEHSLERLQWYYGLGGDFSVNRITRVLRPVDTHQNRALGVLASPTVFKDAVSLLLGTAYNNEAFAVGQVTRRRRPMPVHWLMNWTEHLDVIQRLMRQTPTNSEQGDTGAGDSDRLTPLSSNPDVYIRNKEGGVVLESTVIKIGGALQQLFDLHQMGRMRSNAVDLGELLDRLGEDDMDADAEAGETLEHAKEPAAIASGTSHPLGAVFSCLDNEPDPLVRVAVLVRMCARLPDKEARLKLQGDLKLLWEEKNVFQRLNISSQRYDQLTDQRLALACGLPLKDFVQRVEAELQQFDNIAALAGEAAQPAVGALLKLTEPILRVAVSLRLLQRLPSSGEREQWARALWEAWSGAERFDGGLFGLLGINVSPPKLPEDTDRPWAWEALSTELTDDVLAWGMDTDEQTFKAQVKQALAQFDEAHPINPRSRSKAGSAKAGAKP